MTNAARCDGTCSAVHLTTHARVGRPANGMGTKQEARGWSHALHSSGFSVATDLYVHGDEETVLSYSPVNCPIKKMLPVLRSLMM